MHLDLDVSPQVSTRLYEAAKMQGLEPAALLERLVIEHLPPVAALTETLSLPPTGRASARLRARLAAEATDDLEAVRQAQESLDAMKQSMNDERIRSGAQKIF